jgi:hypothetical protein
MVSKTTRRAHNRLNKTLCGRIMDDVTGKEFVAMDKKPHPKGLSGKTMGDYALWLMSKGYVGGLVNLLRSQGITIHQAL